MEKDLIRLPFHNVPGLRTFLVELMYMCHMVGHGRQICTQARTTFGFVPFLILTLKLLSDLRSTKCSHTQDFAGTTKGEYLWNE